MSLTVSMDGCLTSCSAFDNKKFKHNGGAEPFLVGFRGYQAAQAGSREWKGREVIDLRITERTPPNGRIIIIEETITNMNSARESTIIVGAMMAQMIPTW